MNNQQKTHRPGLLKQTNKSHKTGRHRSKGSIANEQKGKVSVKLITKKHKQLLRKEQRRNQSNQIRKNKREEIIDNKRFGSLGNFTAPYLVCILPLNSNIDPLSALTMIEHCTEDTIVHKSVSGITYITVPHLKKRFSFVIPPIGRGNELYALDCLKVCDTTLFLISAINGEDDIFDKWGRNLLNMAIAQGIPTPIISLMDLESIAPKRKLQTKSNVQKSIGKIFPNEKLICLDTNADVLKLMRRISEQKIKIIHNKANRPHMLAENTEYIKDGSVVNGMGTLKLTGYLRGTHLNVNHLVHLPGLGDFQMLQIDLAENPHLLKKENNVQSGVMFKANLSEQISLQKENIPDDMDGEQNWPTEEEIQQAHMETKTSRLIKRIPKGMSDYQACWIPEVEELDGNGENSDDDDEVDEDIDDDEDDYMSCNSESKSDNEYKETEEDLEEYDKITVSEAPVNDEKYDLDMDLQEEKDTWNKIKAARTDEMWPDQIDTPLDNPARKRFEKYRGLESFRTTPWDPKEQLPYDYARIYQFKNFDRTKRRILKENLESKATAPGCYITVHIANVPESIWNAWKSGQCVEQQILLLYGILPHEHQMSVVNVMLKRTPDSTIPIKSKEKMIIQCGYRRYIVNPIYSAHTNGDKHKYERYFRPNETVVATYYAPIQFPPAPILCFQENPDSTLKLVARGSLLSCNPDRIVLKRIVLSGHPLKINRKTATIRYMFFNREDVEYFKPIKLKTKYGRLGHIKESLGTHGHMKCIFDGQLKSFDTVFLYLYKRIFPKWTYEECIVHSNSTINI